MDEGIHFDKQVSCYMSQSAFPGVILNNAVLWETCKSEDNPLNFLAANLMDSGPVPDFLKDVTYMEQVIIVEIHPVVSFYNIQGAQL